MAWAHEISDTQNRILYQLFDRDNWEVVDEINNFLYIFDRMPPKMRLTVDLKMSGYSNEEVAKIMGVKPQTVRKQLSRVKKRLAHAII